MLQRIDGKALPVEQTDVERLREALTLPDRPNLLKLAERKYDKLKADRQALRERYAAALDLLRAGDASAKRTVDRLQGEIEALGPRLEIARSELNDCRAEFGAQSIEQMGPALADYRSAVLAKLNELEQLLRIGLALQAAATTRCLPVHRDIEASRTVVAHLHAMRAIFNGGN